ncbi:MAG TPA: VWA domain-containing protein, partial [Acidobacteriota bacterium]|nr:VWA domain-containing protein [Acidobacteriota bacterium]
AAFENQTEVTPEHVLRAAELTLNHRTREGGFLEPASPQEIKETLTNKLKEVDFSKRDRMMDKMKGKKEKGEPSREEKKMFPPLGLRRWTNKEKDLGGVKKNEGRIADTSLIRNSVLEKGHFLFDSKPEKGGKASGLAEDTRWTSPKLTKGSAFLSKIRESNLSPFKFLFKAKKASRYATSNVGKRAETIAAIHRGRARGWRIPEGKPSDIHFPATIRTAARMQKFREKSPDKAITIHLEDIREKLRIYKAPMTMIFVLDLSESMLHYVDDIKEAMLKLHTDAYRYRDKVGLVAFKEMGAVVVQHPTTNLKLVSNKLLRLRMSGFTPLATGMLKALEVLKEAKRRDPSTIPVMIIISDGDANVPLRRDLLTGEIRKFDPLDVSFFKYEDEAIKDVLSVSEMMKKERVYTIVINTASSGLSTSSGYITIRNIASITNGIHFNASGSVIKRGEKTASKISEAIIQAQRQVSHAHYLSLKSGTTMYGAST